MDKTKYDLKITNNEISNSNFGRRIQKRYR